MNECMRSIIRTRDRQREELNLLALNCSDTVTGKGSGLQQYFAHYVQCVRSGIDPITHNIGQCFTDAIITVSCASNLVSVRDPLRLASKYLFANGPVRFGVNKRLKDNKGHLVDLNCLTVIFYIIGYLWHHHIRNRYFYGYFNVIDQRRS